MSDEQRTTYRCPSPEDGQRAVLRLSGRDTVVDFFDQSAGGFSIESPKKLHLDDDQMVLLRTCVGWCEAKVIHQEVIGGRTRVGLQRCRELPDPRDAGWSASQPSSRRALGLLSAVVVVFLWSQMFTAGWLSGERRPLPVYEFVTGLVANHNPASVDTLPAAE